MFTTGTTRNCQDIPIENDDILESTEFFFANLNTSDPDVSLEPNVSEISVSEDPNDGMCVDTLTYSDVYIVKPQLWNPSWDKVTLRNLQ